MKERKGNKSLSNTETLELQPLPCCWITPAESAQMFCSPWPGRVPLDGPPGQVPPDGPPRQVPPDRSPRTGPPRQGLLLCDTPGWTGWCCSRWRGTGRGKCSGSDTVDLQRHRCHLPPSSAPKSSLKLPFSTCALPPSAQRP